ncbi:hypothetical protein C7S17_1039 [Burkholderia thailandensis]|nr:hypothetical protein [Burkholderia thailandensis]
MAEEAMRPRTHCRRSIPGSDPFFCLPSAEKPVSHRLLCAADALPYTV